MPQPCTNEGLGDCSDCGPVSACCTLDASAVVVIWSGCGGPVPNIRGWVNDPDNPGQFIIKAWTAPGKTFTKFTYAIQNTQCDPAPGVMEWWEVANWALGTSRTFVRDSATNLRTCCGQQCLPQGHPNNTLVSINPIVQATGTPLGYDSQGNPTVTNNDCQGIQVTGLSGGFTPTEPTIYFLAENHITVRHPCRITEHGVGSLEYCTVDITAEEYTPAIHKAIVDQELNNATYPARGMVRTITHPSPCVVNSGDVQAVSWPEEICELPTPLHIGSDTSRGAKAIIRISDPGLCAPLNGLSGPTLNAEIFKYEGQGGVIHIQDCFNCGQRPATTIPPA